MSDTGKNTTDLETLFHAARTEAADLPEGLADRIMTDAQAIQEDRLSAARSAPPGIFSQFLALLGGWPAVGGLATACAAGIWMGFAPPQAMPDPIRFVQQTEADLFDEDDLYSAMFEDG